MLNFEAVNTAIDNDKKFICVYGHGGVGKTTFVINNSTAPKTAYISLENDGGIKSLAKIDKVITDNVSVLSPDMSVGSPIGVVAQILQELQKPEYDFDTIILDPFTNLRNDQARYLARTEGSSKVTLQMWGDVSTAIDLLFKEFLKLKTKYNLIIVAHEELKQVNDTGADSSTYIIRPNVGEKAAHLFEQYCDEIIRVTKNGHGERVFDLGSQSSNTLGKSRLFGHLHPAELAMTDLKIQTIIGE